MLTTAPLPLPLLLVLGLVVGLAVAALQLWATRRAVERATATGSVTALLLGFPIRVVVPALILVGLLELGVWALIGALIGFPFGRGLLVDAFDRRVA